MSSNPLGFVLYLLIRVVSDLALAPALLPLASHRRHFPLFVASAELLSQIMYDLCAVLSAPRILIKGIEWHFIADVLNLAYGLQVLVHLSVIEDEDLAIALRYFGFFASWVLKYRDRWDSIVSEVGLGALYVLILVASHASDPTKRAAFRVTRLRNGVAAASVGLAFLVASQAATRTVGVGAWFPFVVGASHVSLGLAAYEIWNALPAPSSRAKKSDSLAQAQGASFV